MTVQPALDDPFFEMEDAYEWFAGRCDKADPADLMYPGLLSAPPGYSDMAEGSLKLDKGVGSFDSGSVAWHHFLLPLGREWPDMVLAVLLGLRSRALIAKENRASPFASIWSSIPIAWRVWLYEHRFDGWACLDPRDDSHEAVRWLRERLMLGALR